MPDIKPIPCDDKLHLTSPQLENLVDFLADAMHFCHIHGHSFEHTLDTARMHFDAELSGDDILDDLNHQPTTERRIP